MKNYYELLEVDKNASKEIIEKVYKIHIKTKHPDLYHGVEKDKAEEHVKKLNQAYDVLSDDTKRQEYDEMLDTELNDTVDKQSFEMLFEENNKLKQIIADKNEIIQNFLGDMDLSEIESMQEQRHRVNPNYYSQNEINSKYEGPTGAFRYYILILTKLAIRIAILAAIIVAAYLVFLYVKF